MRGKGGEPLVESLVAGAAEGGAGALQVAGGQPRADAFHDRGNVGNAFGEEYMQVACGAAFARQPLGLGRKSAHLGPVDRRAKHAERRAQAA